MGKRGRVTGDRGDGPREAPMLVLRCREVQGLLERRGEVTPEASRKNAAPLSPGAWPRETQFRPEL